MFTWYTFDKRIIEKLNGINFYELLFKEKRHSLSLLQQCFLFKKLNANLSYFNCSNETYFWYDLFDVIV